MNVLLTLLGVFLSSGECYTPRRGQEQLVSCVEKGTWARTVLNSAGYRFQT